MLGANRITDPWQLAVHAELRAVARRLLRGERAGHTLQPTALVHEAWLRLVHRPDAQGLPQERFVALAVTTMRRVLVDSARRRAAACRDGSQRAAPSMLPASDAGMLALDEALQALAAADAELARLVELRAFDGLGVDEIARRLGTSPRTVKRRWQFARSWLAREIRRRDA